MNMANFTSDWFTPHTDGWLKHVVPLLGTMANVHWLEIGSYEGRSALWTLDNVLRGPSSDIVCVDIFGPTYEKTFDSNVSGIDRLLKLKGHSHRILPSLPARRFHGIYVDGSHDETCVKIDLREAWRLSRTGAILIFDDYPCLEYPGVKTAVDEFLRQIQGKYKLLHKNWQMIIRKESPP